MPNLLTPATIKQTKRYLVLAAFCLVALLVGAHEIFGHNGYLARRRHRLQIDSLTAEIQNLKRENTELSRKIQALRSDPDTIEKLAREQLRLGRPGDVVVTLNPFPQPAPAASAPSK